MGRSFSIDLPNMADFAIMRNLKSKLSKNDQGIIVFLSNYERNNFLSYFPFSDLLNNHLLYFDRKEKLVINAIKTEKQSDLQQVFIHLQFFFL